MYSCPHRTLSPNFTTVGDVNEYLINICIQVQLEKNTNQKKKFFPIQILRKKIKHPGVMTVQKNSHKNGNFFSGMFMTFFVLILVRQLHKTLYIFKVHTPIAALSSSGL